MGRIRSLLAICAVLLFLLAAVALVAAADLMLSVTLAELLVSAIMLFFSLTIARRPEAAAALRAAEAA
jgi:hypothetical protein